jgi:hypothetical protein
VIVLALAAPTHPEALRWSVMLRPPLEAAPLLLALAALRAPVVRAAAAVALWAALTVKLADFAMNSALARNVDWVSDAALLPAAWGLTTGAVGSAAAAAAVAAAAAALTAAFAALWWATGVWSRLPLPRRPAALAAGALAALAAADALAPRGLGLPAQAFTARAMGERVAQTRATLRDLATFRIAAADDPTAAAPPDLAGLAGRDLIVIFIESYGRSSIVNPLYSDTHAGALRAAEAALAEAGLAMRSAWLTAPTAGGQSWLSHATLVSGLWIDGQGRYGALLASPRRTLHHAAQAAGRRTVAIKPAHTIPWPEGAWFGFDAVHDAAGLGYRGPPFNWVTMPDQFTLTVFDRLERDRAPRPPLTAQIALVSSHAPWTPVAPVLPWDEVGDGSVYAPFAAAGDPPEVVWLDPDRIREQFRQSIAYSLTVVGEYLARHAGSGAVTIVLGDHEPAAFVAGGEGREVPIHLVGPPEALARIDGWGFTPGMVPAEDAPVWSMDAFRDRFLSAFSDASS